MAISGGFALSSQRPRATNALLSFACSQPFGVPLCPRLYHDAVSRASSEHGSPCGVGLGATSNFGRRENLGLRPRSPRFEGHVPAHPTTSPLPPLQLHESAPDNATRVMSATAKEVKKDKHVQQGPVHYPFWFGGSASCCAVFLTHPLDLGEWVLYAKVLDSFANVLQSRLNPPGRSPLALSAYCPKVRLQTQPHGAERRNMGQMFVHVAQGSGLRGLYKGVCQSHLEHANTG